ncbi:hypothetical protein GCM10009789_64020 [Kribbella sancticallisti]|uniref:Uncharacterized protein n=1 Tax=Kribbella sancticallisti TaxID=460087 RepID=A0ABN2EA69_9ACTN
MNPSHREPRLFHLIRQASAVADPLAEGVEWSDGTVALRWRGQWPATSAWEGGIDAVLAVHGANGTTELRWLVTVPGTQRPPSTANPALRTPVTSTPAPRSRVPPTSAPRSPGARPPDLPAVGSLRLPAAGMDGRCVQCGQVWPCLSCGP